MWYTLLRARDLPVLAEDALAVDTLVLPVDLEVGALGHTSSGCWFAAVGYGRRPVVCRHAGAAQGVGTVVGSRLHLHQFSILQQGTAAQHLHGCVVNCGCPQSTWAGTLREGSCWTACGMC